jgi:acetate---CoA ligase (ADP-forming)
MEKFFYPQSVAVAGVSEDPANLARGIVYNLLEFGYQGKIFPVGPRGGAIFGLPILLRLEELPQPVDLAVILTPARFVPEAVATCGELGISRVVVESAGFSELSPQGRALEGEIRALLQKYRLRLVGPNGLGVMNLEIGLALPFASFSPRPRLGPISIVAQSGGVATHLFAWMTREGLGLNKFFSLGNKLDVTENDALEYLLTDPGTRAIYLYLEGLSDGRKLLSLARQAGKPIFLQLANVGEETATIAHSHTASLTTDERVLDAACRQGGITHIKSQTQFLNAARLVEQPRVPGHRLVVFSRSGGEAVVAAYACRRYGFQLPPLSPSLVQLIRERSRAGVIAPANPIDLGDIFDFTVYSDVMAAVCRDPEVDAVLFHYGPVADFEISAGREMARRMVALAREAGKPLAIVVLCTLEEEAFFRETLKVPVFHFPEEAVQALALSRDWAAGREPLALSAELPGSTGQEIAAILAAASPTPCPSGLRSPLSPLGGEGQGEGHFLPLPQALSLTAALGLPVAPWLPAASAAEAAAAAAQLGYPVVMKLAAPSLVHKTESGGVLLDLKNPEAVARGFTRLAQLAREQLPAGEPWQALIMSQVAGGLEVLLGARRDRAFGPVVAFGAGGVVTEVLDDVALRVAPLNDDQARRLLAETKIGRILAGIRGQPSGDLEALARALSALSRLMEQFPQIQEVDLNPVKVFPGQKGLLALDARIRVGP